MTAYDGRAGAAGSAGAGAAGGHDFDVVVVGSGFGGSVAALRLTEKGYRVAVLEAGRRFEPHELPRNTWDTRRYLFAPALGCYGIQRFALFDDVFVIAGAGVGGGSLVYAAVLYEPLDGFYADPQWAGITDWRDELAPYYDQAKRMLGVTEPPAGTDADAILRAVADRMGCARTWRPTNVGVHFAERPTVAGHGGDGVPGATVPDPYFGGAGPERRGCIQCGECLSGCRHGAKNTLLTNYLHLAERAGARVVPMATVTEVRPLPGGDGRRGYQVTVQRTGTRSVRERTVLTAGEVVLAAGAMGTAKLLHRMRDEDVLPRLSPRLGHLTRTNSESIVGAEISYREFRRHGVRLRPDADGAPSADGADGRGRGSGRLIETTHGVSHTSSIFPDAHTHVEIHRFGRGSNAVAPLRTVAVPGEPRARRWRRWLRTVTRDPGGLALPAATRRWSERSVQMTVMQDTDNSLEVRRTRFLLWHRLATRPRPDAPNPTYIPLAEQAGREAAEVIGGRAVMGVSEIVDIPVTAHFIGGCPIGESGESGVVDAYQRVFGYEGLHVVDGSALSANLGVNPSLTITAQAERAMALWPNRGEADPRPPVGSAYVRVAPVAPRNPVVPDDAPGALRLPIVDVR